MLTSLVPERIDATDASLDEVRLEGTYNAAISLIKNIRQPIEITVFFGTWCSYCKHYLPGFMKSIELAANPAITVRYIGISEDMSEPEALLTADGSRSLLYRVNGEQLLDIHLGDQMHVSGGRVHHDLTINELDLLGIGHVGVEADAASRLVAAGPATPRQSPAGVASGAAARSVLPR